MPPEKLKSDPQLKSDVRSLLRNLEKPGFRFFCAACKRERKIDPPAKVGSPAFFLHVALSTAFFSLVFWPWMGPKGILAFLIPAGLVLEGVYRLKMRAVLACPDCRFDPVLFLSDRTRAVKQVEAAWREKFTREGIPFPENPRTSRAPRRSLDLRE